MIASQKCENIYTIAMMHKNNIFIHYLLHSYDNDRPIFIVLENPLIAQLCLFITSITDYTTRKRLFQTFVYTGFINIYMYIAQYLVLYIDNPCNEG